MFSSERRSEMSPTISLVQQVRIASPCPERWEDMRGDDKRRFCGRCELHVHNLSAMTAREIETLLRTSTGRICGRLYRRPDGTVLTQNCPVGLASVRRTLGRSAARIAALLLLILGPLTFGWLGMSRDTRGDGTVSPVAQPPGQTLTPPIAGELILAPALLTPDAG